MIHADSTSHKGAHFHLLETLSIELCETSDSMGLSRWLPCSAASLMSDRALSVDMRMIELTDSEMQTSSKAMSDVPTDLPTDDVLPAGALRFAMAAKKARAPAGSAHRRNPSATSVMDPLDGAPSISPLATKVPLPLPVDPTGRLLHKIGLPSVSALQEASLLLGQACELTDDDIVLLVSLLGPSSPLCALHLNGNAIGDQGLVALAQSSAMSQLRHLSLASNRITDAGCAELLLALAPDCLLFGVREINLRGNPLTEEMRSRLRGRHHQNYGYVAL